MRSPSRAGSRSASAMPTSTSWDASAPCCGTDPSRSAGDIARIPREKTAQTLRLGSATMAYTAGVDVGGTKILGIAVDDAGHRVGQEVRRPTPQGSEALFDALVGVLSELRAQVGDLDAIGIGIPGLIDRNGSLALGPN